MPVNKATAADAKPLPLSDTLHDLAVLRASDIDLAAFLPVPAPSDQAQTTSTQSPAPRTKPEAVDSNRQTSAGDSDSSESERDRLVARSFEYVREGRAAIRLLHRGDVDSQGARVDKVRSELEEILRGLGPEPEDGHQR
ncbi:hypothetical protein ACEPAI_7573 [Sanghuangporus weigelae]